VAQSGPEGIMTTATAVREDEAILSASAVLIRAYIPAWPDAALPAIKDARGSLLDAIEIRDAIEAGTLHWEAYDADLRTYADPYEAALAQSGIDADDCAGWLIEVIAKRCSAVAAAYVSRDAA
jgi:hypothetical protein